MTVAGNFDSARCVASGPCPCDGCPNQEECRKGKACHDFAFYVETGKVMDKYRNPKRKIFTRTMTGDNLKFPWKKLYKMSRQQRRGKLISTILEDSGVRL